VSQQNLRPDGRSPIALGLETFDTHRVYDQRVAFEMADGIAKPSRCRA